MYIVKNTGTMVIGVAKELQIDTEDIMTINSGSNNSGYRTPEQKSDDPHLFQIVASDTTVFQEYTRSYYNIEDKEIIKISLKDKIEKHKLQAVKEEIVQIRKPAGVDHFYIMEMLDQPEAVCKALNYGARFIPGQSLVKLGGLE